MIRSERKEDHSAIYRVNKLAFKGEEESKLVEKLRKSKSYNKKLSLVAIEEGKVVGHILFTPITIENKNDSYPALALAPLAVHPDYQNQGIGSSLVTLGLRAASRLKYGIVIVLGNPQFYKRFGFVPASSKGIKAPFDVADEMFLVKENSCRGLHGVEGTVRYPKAILDLI